MESISAIITALVSGAVAASHDTAQQAILDLYTSLKQLIKDKYQQVHSSLIALENKPDSETKHASLQEDLQDSGAATDKELLQQAQALLAAIENQAPQLAQAIGIKLEDVKAANVRLQEIIVSGEQAAGVYIKNGEFSGDIEIREVKVEASKKK